MFQILNADGGGYFWRLKASNGETLCHSEVYSSKQAARVGIASVKVVVPAASTTDHT